MPFLELKSEILDQDMCTRCGACVAVCPPGLLSISDDHMPVPALDPEAMPCAECSLCLDVCPGKDTATPASKSRIFGRSRTPAERWTGIFRRSLVLTSTNPRVLAGAAAGGAGTTLMLTALRSGLADAVIVVGRDAQRPWVPAALITDSEDEVIRCGQTSYCLTPNLQLLRDPRFKRIALIGVPCEVQAVRKMQNLDPLPEVAEKIVLAVEIACASSTKLAGTEYLITEKLGIKLHDVAEMRYREGEYPGQFTVKTHDGTRKSLPFFEVVDEFKRHKTHRCLVCGDWWSGLADVSISDGDPNIYASSQSGAKPPRQSIVMTRTEEGEKIVQAAVRLGLATVTPRPFIAEGRISGYSGSAFAMPPLPRACRTGWSPPPVDYEETETLLSDTEVINRMSYHMKIMPSRPEAAGRGKKAPVTVGLSLTSAREIVLASSGRQGHRPTRRARRRPLGRDEYAAQRSPFRRYRRQSRHSPAARGRHLGGRRHVLRDRWPRLARPQTVREEIDVEPRQLGDDRAHPHGTPCRHAGRRIPHRRQRIAAPASDVVDRRAAAPGGSRHRLRSFARPVADPHSR